jgi:cytochrome c-type biogenesis protein CcmH
MSRLLLLVLALCALAAPPAVLAAEPRASLPDIEDEVMCVSCNVALNVAESPQAYRQRELIRTMVDRGMTKTEIKAALVDEYGADVLAMPEDEGIGLAAYLVPIGVVLALVALAALLLPRWRRQTGLTPATAGPAASDTELARLDADLRRTDR